jgi:hypothetical protein
VLLEVRCQMERELCTLNKIRSASHVVNDSSRVGRWEYVCVETMCIRDGLDCIPSVELLDCILQQVFSMVVRERTHVRKEREN